MRLLLDTHALLWWLFDDPKLASRPRQLIADRENEILVSSASAWEICTQGSPHEEGLQVASELQRVPAPQRS